MLCGSSCADGAHGLGAQLLFAQFLAPGAHWHCGATATRPRHKLAPALAGAESEGQPPLQHDPQLEPGRRCTAGGVRDGTSIAIAHHDSLVSSRHTVDSPLPDLSHSESGDGGGSGWPDGSIFIGGRSTSRLSSRHISKANLRPNDRSIGGLSGAAGAGDEVGVEFGEDEYAVDDDFEEEGEAAPSAGPAAQSYEGEQSLGSHGGSEWPGEHSGGVPQQLPRRVRTPSQDTLNKISEKASIPPTVQEYKDAFGGHKVLPRTPPRLY